MTSILTKTYQDGIFDISEKFGFLPSSDPIERLPSEFEELQKIIDIMPVTIGDSYGLLSKRGEIEKYIKDIPDYTEKIGLVTDKMILQALFRSYAFISSAYLLEPAHFHYKEYGSYDSDKNKESSGCPFSGGNIKTTDEITGKNFLPKNIAKPFVLVADKLKVFPWMEYHYAYSLCNYKKIDKSKDKTWDNLEMIAKFSGSRDETGFIMIHVDINRFGKDLINSIKNTLSGNIIDGLDENYNIMIKINEVRKQMWIASNHHNYQDFRTFIMGITGNTSIFGDGVIYEDCFDNKPQQFRGQSGSQDDIIPTEDIFCGVINYYPENELTKYLLDMRQYRPDVVQEFLKDLMTDCVGLYDKIKMSGVDNMIRLLKIVNQVYIFRNGHWQFVQKYIMANTKYNVATGGTPITTWIVNQIEACLKYMGNIIEEIKSFNDIKLSKLYDDYLILEKEHNTKIKILVDQVNELKKTDYNASLIYDLNKDMKEA